MKKIYLIITIIFFSSYSCKTQKTPTEVSVYIYFKMLFKCSLLILNTGYTISST
jgi:hypothetical protein